MKSRLILCYMILMRTFRASLVAQGSGKVVKYPPANAGEAISISGPGRPYMPQNN